VFAAGQLNAQCLQVRFELPSGNTGNLGTDPAKVLGLTANFNAVTYNRFFAAYGTLAGHCLALPTTNFQLNNRKHLSYTGVGLLVKQKTLKAAACPRVHAETNVIPGLDEDREV